MIPILGAAAFALLAAYLVDRRRRVYADLGTIPAGVVYAGRNEVKGRVWHPTPVRSHLTGTPCVRWSYELEEERRHTRQTKEGTETYRQWHTVETRDGGSAHFDLVDRSGSVRIVLAAASVTERRFHVEEFRAADDRGFLERLLSFGPNRTGRYRQTESGLAIGDAVYVVGEATLRDDVVEPQIAHGSPFVVSTRSEESHRSWLGAGTVVLIALGLALAYLAGSAASNPALARPTALGAAVVAVIAIGLVALYNRIQQQVQQAARAWSLIDIQLTRRHDLIPALATVARAASDHERVVLESVMETRSSLHGAPPTEATIADADREAREQTDRIRRLFAVIEDDPDLRSDTAFAELQRQIADAENRIAATREFYNDAVTMVRDQRSTFPGLLVARFADRRRFSLFEGKGFERTVPPIRFDFDDVSG